MSHFSELEIWCTSCANRFLQKSGKTAKILGIATERKKSAKTRNIVSVECHTLPKKKATVLFFSELIFLKSEKTCASISGLSAFIEII